MDAFDLGVRRPFGDRVTAAVTMRNLFARLYWKAAKTEGQPREVIGAVSVALHARARAAISSASDMDGQLTDRVHAALEVDALPGQWSLLAGWETRRRGDDFDGRFSAGTRFVVDRVRVDYAFQAAEHTPGDTHRFTLGVAL